MKLVLATKSEFAVKALYDAGYDFEVKLVTLCSQPASDQRPRVVAVELCLEQLSAAASAVNTDEPTTVLSVETVLACNDEILDYPKTRSGDPSPERLKSYLARYANYPVRAYTAVGVKNLAGGLRSVDYAMTQISFHPFTSTEMYALSLDQDSYQFAGGLAFNSKNPKTPKLLNKKVSTVVGDMKNFTQIPLMLTQTLLKHVECKVKPVAS